ncbi:MAG: sensor histidine kinase [Candidatus Limnocylindria bacterium]
MDQGLGAAFDALLAHRGRDVLLLVDAALRIVRAGPQVAELAVRAEAELPGMSLIAVFGSASLDAVARRCAQSRAPEEGEVELGGLTPRSFSVDAIPLARGGMVLALRDVSALRRVERVRRDFVANIGHELRTPLTSVKLLAETINSESLTDAATIRDFAAQIEREADHLTRLVDELLDLSMIESGETRLTIESVGPADVVANCLDRIRPVAQRRDVSVASTAPADDRDVRARADTGRLGQALLNLAHNAVKFSHSGGEIRIGWTATDDRVRFSVADDGIGVPVAHQARIFERFYKVDRSRARGEEESQAGVSAGLGLAIVRHIAEAHGGSAGAVSDDGAGSTFWIEVPRA